MMIIVKQKGLEDKAKLIGLQSRRKKLFWAHLKMCPVGRISVIV